MLELETRREQVQVNSARCQTQLLAFTGTSALHCVTAAPLVAQLFVSDFFWPPKTFSPKKPTMGKGKKKAAKTGF